MFKLLLPILLVAATDPAPSFDIAARLIGYQETPAIASSGSGEFFATVRPEDGVIEYTLSYANLPGTTVSHIHFGQRAVAGGISAFLCGGGSKPACPDSDATITGTITPDDIIGPTAQGIGPGEFGKLVDAIVAGKTYVNVHTNTHPGGEIRGQVVPRRDE